MKSVKKELSVRAKCMRGWLWNFLLNVIKEKKGRHLNFEFNGLDWFDLMI
jgi:hypothetical protein